MENTIIETLKKEGDIYDDSGGSDCCEETESNV